MSNHEANDLSALIQQAARQVKGEAAIQVARDKATEPSRRPRIVAQALLLGLICYLGYGAVRLLTPPPASQVASDLEIAVDAARALVESAKATNGTLPEALPSASLASVVAYSHDRDRYQLSATILGVKVTLEQDGKKTIETGMAP
jgi:hypothetical protein